MPRLVRRETNDQRERQRHRGAPVGPAPFLHPDGRRWLEDIRGRDRPRRPVRLVVLPDQRLRIRSDDPGDAADVPAGIETPAAGRVLTALDAPDDCLPDAGPLADLRDGETCLAARCGQGITDAHAAPPLLCSTACRPGDASSSYLNLQSLRTCSVTKCRQHHPWLRRRRGVPADRYRLSGRHSRRSLSWLGRRTSTGWAAAPQLADPPRSEAMSPGSSSGLTSTSMALDPSLGPTTPRLSSRSISRPAFAQPTRSLRWSIEVEPNWVLTMSSAASHSC